MSQTPSSSPLPNEEQRARLRRKRAFKDHLSRYGIGTAGIGVVVTLTLIFVYLFSVVVPMFKSPTADHQFSEPLPTLEADSADAMQHLAMERYEELASLYTNSGEARFFEMDGGALRESFQLPFPEGARVTSHAVGEAQQGVVALGYDNGQAMVVRHEYGRSFPDGERFLEPELTYPVGDELITVDPEGRALEVLAVQSRRGETYVAAITDDGEILLSTFSLETNMMTGEERLEQEQYRVGQIDGKPGHMLLNNRFRHLYVSDAEGQIHHFNIDRLDDIRKVETVTVSETGNVTSMDFLIGTVSVIVGTSAGEVSQWFPVRDDSNQYSLQRIRDFQGYEGAITHIAPEYFRKGFWVADDQGHIGVHHTTSHSDLMRKKVADVPITKLAISPRDGRLIAVDTENRMHSFEVWNKHPETSFSSLWHQVWYEGRSEPDYVWQSSSASDDFEPKMSLVPLSIGTLKAAFYAMLFAIPLGIMGAIYTAYFMTPKLRGVVKPSIEIMEALPTVILGFLAGLWLAPFVENHLPAVFSILLLMPVAMLAFGLLWSRLPLAVRTAIPQGWEAVLLVPVVILVGWVCISLSPLMEIWFFEGSMRQWMTDNNIDYDQRNALVVGVAMGFAVIPTIFSISEDAIYTVPKHLTQGSLALGATYWQTLVRVVLPTASPGIFSGAMMGFGRAVGETMIVLMATGNSPVTNFNIFEGMRTLSANIAVELPESAVGSTHFRVLFLAALVLFVLTFILNTLAEVVRQRLRKRYSSL